MKSALITGISGQDGSYLTELLLEKGYEVHGLIRRTSGFIYPNIEHIRKKIVLHYGGMETEHHLCSLINDIKPDEIYNLAAQSDVGISFETPESTFDITGNGALRLFEAVRKFSPSSKVYQASTSELFGNSPAPQNENTPMKPTSPYAVAKLAAHNLALIYREAYGLFISCGILFNHESPRRGPNFVTRKITMAVADIVAGNSERLELGNLLAKRDWGFAPDYVKAMWLMLQQNKPDDFVIGTGETHTVGEFAEYAFEVAGLNWSKHVVVNPKYYRPLDTNYLQADTTKAKEYLEWEASTNIRGLVNIMVDADLRRVNESLSRNAVL